MTKKGWQQGLYRNTPWCIVTRRRAEGRAVLRPRPRHGQVRTQHTPTIRQPVRSRYGHGGLRHARHDAQGRGARRVGAWGAARARMSAATRRLGLRYGRGPQPRHDQACPQYGQACLCAPGCAQLGQFGCFVHSDSIFDPV